MSGDVARLARAVVARRRERTVGVEEGGSERDLALGEALGARLRFACAASAVTFSPSRVTRLGEAAERPLASEDRR